jgi:hypothetical protein
VALMRIGTLYALIPDPAKIAQADIRGAEQAPIGPIEECKTNRISDGQSCKTQ